MATACRLRRQALVWRRQACSDLAGLGSDGRRGILCRMVKCLLGEAVRQIVADVVLWVHPGDGDVAGPVHARGTTVPSSPKQRESG